MSKTEKRARKRLRNRDREWNSSFLQRDNIRHWKTHNVAMITGAKEQWATTYPTSPEGLVREEIALEAKDLAVAHKPEPKNGTKMS